MEDSNKKLKKIIKSSKSKFGSPFVKPKKSGVKYDKRYTLVSNTQYDKRLTPANCINNMNKQCRHCGTDVLATHNDLKNKNKVTVYCSTYSHTYEIKPPASYHEALAAFCDNHP